MDGTKLAGPATGGYDGGQKMPSHKRKRDKAQDQLRSRMRHRMNGNGNSSAILHAKRRSALLDGTGDASLSAGIRHSSSVEVTSRDLQGANYWRTQQERYNKLTNVEGSRQPRLGGNQNVPLQELVDRVLHRQDQSLGLGSQVSPMTIRAYKPPVAPYAIQQSSHVKKIVKMKPIQRQDAEDKGPFVLVLQRNGSEEQVQPRGRRRSRNRSSKDLEHSATIQDQMPSLGATKVLPPVHASKQPEVSEPGTWRPALGQMHNPSVLPEAEDRSVTNFRLQMQQANKLAGSRFEFHHEVPANKTVEEMTMQSLNPLPPIQSAYPADEDEIAAVDRMIAGHGDEAVQESGDEQHHTMGQDSSDAIIDRTSSKNEILNMRRAQKEAKRQKQNQAEEYTLLRTRKRYTSKTTQFKSDLERARQLSAIQEDRSSLNSARLSGSSGHRPSMSASTDSSNSLKRIEELITDDSSLDEECSPRNGPEHSVRVMLPAPPTTSPTDNDLLDSGVIMNVDVMNSTLGGGSHGQFVDDTFAEETHTSGLNSDTLLSSSSSSSTSEDTEPMQAGDIADGMTLPSRQKPTPEHGR